VEIDEDDLFGEPANPDEQIIARRATMDEYLEYIGKVEYINGRMITVSGVELFLGIEQFPKAIRALEQELAEMQRKSISQHLLEKDKS
jgi:hypothetical protein